ncbi:hypothetical protein [Bacillus suaedaesalsae]|uniref:Uncharacterized protein n=1 Tax=Bacillus suaedaesalsae TaxID=2810349 RepID=A0ABS2DHV9_9BACI|nr:hypothetical protein [Bacillus suaedaesalsae]MBM6617997.1 hypothetical protein [Bacillus suaedaesalsae]
MAKLTIKRDSQFANKMRSYTVFLNGEEIGKIKNGETFNYILEPGENTLYLQIDWCKSKEHSFQVTSVEEEHVFQCGSRLKGWKVFLASTSLEQEDVFVYLEKNK